MAEIKRKKNPKGETLTVSGDATIAGMKELKAVLAKTIAASSSVHIAFGEITAVDVTLLQLLCSAHRVAADRNRTLTVERGTCEPVDRLMEQAGFLRHIGCSEKTRRDCLWITQQK